MFYINVPLCDRAEPLGESGVSSDGKDVDKVVVI
jgi:hypothetical protein